MATPIRMPALGQTSDELRLLTWLKAEGDQVIEGEPLFEAESDKATLEVEAASGGTLLKLLCEPGQTVVAGTVLAWVGDPGEQVPEEQATAPATRVLATPAARSLARERGIDLARVTGSGPGGRIERANVLAAASDSASGERVPKHRQAIAERLVRATSVPQFTVAKTIDARGALERVAGGEGATLTHLLLHAVAVALRVSPLINRAWVEDGPRFRTLDRCDVGLAIASDDKLIVATIPEPDRLSLAELAEETRRVVDEGRAGRVTVAPSGPPAVTVSNLGMFGIDRFEAIVDPDQTAILAVGRIAERPAVTDEGIHAIPQVDLTLTVDHRTVNGAEAARFLSAVCAELET